MMHRNVVHHARGVEEIAKDAASSLVATLVDLDVKRVFGLCGDHVNPLYHACLKAGVEIVSTRHEAAAVHMADAWARSTGNPAVAIVNGGPGLTNALTGVATAHLSASPVLLIAGQYATGLTDRGALQEIDQVGLLRPITKWTRVLSDPDRMPEYVATALQRATSGRPGPVALVAPFDVLRASVAEQTASAAGPAVVFATAGRPDPEGREGKALRRWIAEARRPVLIAGSEAYWGRCQDALVRLADRASVPVFTIDLARGLLPDRHPAAHGYPDPALNPAAREIESADLVILLGHNLDYRTEFGRPLSRSATVVQVSRDPHEHSRNRMPSQLWTTDLSAFLDMLGSFAEPHAARFAIWNQHLQGRRTQLRSEWIAAAKAADGAGIHPIDVCGAVRAHIDERTSLLFDGGDFAQWPRAYLPANRSGAWLRLGPMATLGASVPFANAVQLARPGEKVVVFIGDGGVGFCGWELHTAVRYGLPIKVVVGNDGKWGTELRLQAAQYGKEVYGVDVGELSYDAFARALGAWGRAVHDRSELKASLEELMSAPGPALLDVRIRTSGQPTDQR